MDTGFPPEWRAKIRKQYLTMGMPAVRTDAIIDLAIHAVNSAVERLGEVVKASDEDAINTLALALQLLQIRAEIAHTQTAQVMDKLRDDCASARPWGGVT